MLLPPVCGRTVRSLPPQLERPMRPMLKPSLFLIGLACLSAGLPACRIVATSQKNATTASDGSTSNDAAFDPDKMVAGLWEPKVIPYLTAKAGSFADVRDLARKSPDEAGAKFGYRAKEGTTPWTLVVKIEGRIVAVDTASRAGTISVDTDKDGKADLTVQIGPAMRGTALRDSLDFVSFNNFTNQIDFARFGKSFNQYVNRTVLEALPREALNGRPVTILGAFPLEKSDDLPLVTPAQITVGPAS